MFDISLTGACCSSVTTVFFARSVVLSTTTIGWSHSQMLVESSYLTCVSLVEKWRKVKAGAASSFGLMGEIRDMDSISSPDISAPTRCNLDISSSNEVLDEIYSFPVSLWLGYFKSMFKTCKYVTSCTANWQLSESVSFMRPKGFIDCELCLFSLTLALTQTFTTKGDSL